MADVLAVRDAYRAQNLAMVIQECSNSGLSNREFCRQRGISEKTYYYSIRWPHIPVPPSPIAVPDTHPGLLIRLPFDNTLSQFIENLTVSFS